MTYSDMELAYLLTAYGQKLYSLALEHTKHKENALEILQKVFLELVCFPPALKENQTKEQWLIKRTQKLCKAYPKDQSHIATHEPLAEEDEDELLALMKEARDHEGILQRPAPKWRPAYTVAVSVVGFLLAITITLITLLSVGGKTYTDEQGSADLLAPPPTNQEEPPKKEPPKQEIPTPPPAEEDPLPPEIINNSSRVTFTTLSDFVEAIDQKRAEGYGKNYYNTRALLLLPNRLPNDAVFRCLYLDPQTGNYSYSFRFEYQKTLYLLEFKVEASLPTTAMDVGNYTAAIRKEKVQRKVAENTLTCAFGKDQVSATLSTPKSEESIDPAIANKLFSSVILERCSPENPFLQN